MIVTVILWLKVLYSNVILGGAKMKAGKRAPEDTYQSSSDKVKPEAIAAVDRCQRIVNNDLENIPYGLITAWAAIFSIGKAVASGGSSDYYTAHAVLIIAFAVSRIAHTMTYAMALSYARSIAWVLGVLSVIGMGINGIIASFMV
jgi:uncharacterized MAPEG superfamily protein